MLSALGFCLAGIFLTINLVAFVAMRRDKANAQIVGQIRTPERELLMLAAMGGAIGIYCGMYYPPRHKSQKASFQSQLFLIALWWLTLLVAIAFLLLG